MRNKKQHLLMQQTDKKLIAFKQAEQIAVPPKGWLNTVRISLNMTLNQLADKLNISIQSISELERREADGNITINRLRSAANAMDMKLVYGFIPVDGSIEKKIEKRVTELAREIVLRTSDSMKLENQEIAKERIENAIREKAAELKDELPKFIWG